MQSKYSLCMRILTSLLMKGTYCKHCKYSFNSLSLQPFAAQSCFCTVKQTIFAN